MEDAAGLCIRVKCPAALPCSLARSINLHLSSSLHPDDHAALLCFLRHEMPMNLNTDDVRDPIPDQIKRIQLIYDTKENLQKSFGDDFVFTHLHQIGILLFGDDLIQGNDYTISERLTLLEPFLARFLQKNTVIPSNLNMSTSPPEPGAKEVNRNKSESNKALERDGKRCLVTGAIKPDVCHIIPYRLNSNPATEPQSRDIFARILVHIVPAEDGKNLMRLLFPTHQGKQVLGASDKIWNLLTLSPQVHRFWSSCYFAFKWVGVLNPDPNAKTQTVQLEFRWMPRSIALALGDEGLGKARPQHARKGDAFRPVNTDAMTPERMHDIIRDCMDSSSLTSTVQPQYQQPTGEYPTR
uniref:HNH nuclease domain-containing protein n=1 Tax=Bionectria ochroleuca TaxID=29856 RepID=A0A8H7N3R2_BIOOC